MAHSKDITLEDALKAQSALRADAGLAPENFPIQAFVGMISDEIEALRGRGRSDEQIAQIIHQSSGISISAEEIQRHYASPDERHGAH